MNINKDMVVRNLAAYIRENSKKPLQVWSRFENREKNCRSYYLEGKGAP